MQEASQLDWQLERLLERSDAMAGLRRRLPPAGPGGRARPAAASRGRAPPQEDEPHVLHLPYRKGQLAHQAEDDLRAGRGVELKARAGGAPGHASPAGRAPAPPGRKASPPGPALPCPCARTWCTALDAKKNLQSRSSLSA